MKRNSIRSILAAMTMLLATVGTALAVPMGQLGILDLSANGGINPATGAAWANGDTYRLIFATSAGRDATSTDINDYNAFVNNLAQASPFNSGALAGATWKAVASTGTVDARDNTNTNINVDGPGESIWLVNGTSLVADDYADLYGSNTHDSVINVSETGGTPFDGGDFTSVWTGSDGAGRAKDSGPNAQFGGLNHLGAADGDSLTGLWNFTSGAHWIERFNIDNTQTKGLYGLSEVLTVTDPDLAVPEPATATLAILGLGGLAMRRRRRNHA